MRILPIIRALALPVQRQSALALDAEELLGDGVVCRFERGRVPDGRGGGFADEAGRDAFDEVGVLHESGGDVVFALEGFGNGPVAAEAHLAQGDLDAGGGALVEGFEGGAGPGGVFGFEGGEDFGDGVVGETAVDGGAEGPGEEDGFVGGEAGGEFFDGGVDDGVAVGERGVVFEDEFGET